ATPAPPSPPAWLVCCAASEFPFMARSRPRPTAQVEQNILAYIRAGGYPHVCAEVAGVPAEAFQDWMNRPRDRSFAGHVRQAHAQERLGAEIAIRTDRPLDWLRYRP